jgi:nifR3 family TIM-barrel protein
MNIGPLTLSSRVILAPMAGISDLAYRQTMKPFGAGLVYTEMVSAKGLLHSGRRTRELLRSDPDERPLGIQLFGSEPDDLAAAAASVAGDGDLIDLNLGCPVNKVIRGGAGSALLREPQRVGRIIAAVRRAVSCPLTIKIRSGWDNIGINYLDIGRIAAEEGADAITLHPRTRAQGFTGSADWQQIGVLKAALRIPVIGSGDIMSGDDARRMVETTGCDGVMIGRGGYGNPWLIRDAVRALDGLPPQPAPTAAERQDVALAHLARQVTLIGPAKAVLEMRKHLCWYARGLPGAAAFRSAVNQTFTLDDLRSLVQDFFQSSPHADEAAYVP